MAVEIPGWLRPFYDLCGLPFPDINEDEFLALRAPLEEFAQSIVDLCSVIERALGDLEGGSSSNALEAIATHLRSIRQTYLEPFRRGVDEVAESPLQFLHDVVRDVKLVLIAEAGIAAAEVVAALANTVDTLGASDALALAGELGIKRATKEALRIAESELETHLVTYLQQRAESLLNHVVRPFLDHLERELEGVINNFSPAFVPNSGSGPSLSEIASSTLHVSVDELMTCARQVESVRGHVEGSIASFRAAAAGMFQSGTHAGPRPDPALRHIAHELIQVFLADLSDAMRHLLHGVIDHFVHLLHGVANATEAMNAQIAAAGSSQPLPSTLVATGVASTAGVAAAANKGVVSSPPPPDMTADATVPTESAASTDSTTGTLVKEEVAAPQPAAASATPEGVQTGPQAPPPSGVQVHNATDASAGVKNKTPRKGTGKKHTSTELHTDGSSGVKNKTSRKGAGKKHTPTEVHFGGADGVKPVTPEHKGPQQGPHPGPHKGSHAEGTNGSDSAAGTGSHSHEGPDHLRNSPPRH